MPRSYQVTPVGPSHQKPAKRMLASPKTARTLRARHLVFRTQPPQRGKVTLTLRWAPYRDGLGCLAYIDHTDRSGVMNGSDPEHDVPSGVKPIFHPTGCVASQTPCSGPPPR